MFASQNLANGLNCTASMRFEIVLGEWWPTLQYAVCSPRQAGMGCGRVRGDWLFIAKTLLEIEPLATRMY